MADKWIEYFKEIFSAGKEISLLNVFKGIPLSFPAKIEQIDENHIHVCTENHQAVCMYLEKSTYIQSDMLPEVLRADVIDLDAENHLATLGNFSQVKSDIGSRHLVRIQPQEPLEGDIQLTVEDSVERGELADISQNGLGIYVNSSFMNVWRVSKGDELIVSLRLPGVYSIGEYRSDFLDENTPIDRFARDNIRFSPVPNREAKKKDYGAMPVHKVSNPKFRIKAIIANITQEKAIDRYRIGMRILSAEPSRTIITQFIAQRQSEIIREIKTLYGMLIKKQ